MITYNSDYGMWNPYLASGERSKAAVQHVGTTMFF
jgi:hypothetical protein